QHVKRTKKIDLDVACPILRVGVENSCGGGQRPGVVDDYASSAELRRGFVYGPPHCGLIRDIARNGEPANFIRPALDCRDAPGEKSHRVALLGEKPRRRLAYAPTRASDQNRCRMVGHLIPFRRSCQDEPILSQTVEP